MRKIISTYIFSWALGFLLMPTAYAETDSNSANNDYRLPTYDKIDFKAEATTDNKVSMSWSAFTGFNDEAFTYYKVIRSHGNSNPIYPEDSAIAVKDAVGDTRHTDEKANKSAYYRVCAITDAKGRHCSNVVWIEIAKAVKPECKNLSSTGECEDAKIEQAKKAKDQKAWQDKQNQAKERLEEKKTKQEAQKAAKQKEWEAKKAEQKKNTDVQKEAMHTSREKQKNDLYNQLYVRLDMWLETFGDRLDNSDISNAQKIEKIEAVQNTFKQWNNGKELRMKMVAHMDENLNAMKAKYVAGEDFSEIDDFLEGLLDS
jgi:hypothetical protein